jgi:hypothetical protein
MANQRDEDALFAGKQRELTSKEKRAQAKAYPKGQKQKIEEAAASRKAKSDATAQRARDRKAAAAKAAAGRTSSKRYGERGPITGKPGRIGPADTLANRLTPRQGVLGKAESGPDPARKAAAPKRRSGIAEQARTAKIKMDVEDRMASKAEKARLILERERKQSGG